MPLPLAALIAGGSSLLGSAISSFSGRSAQNQANQTNLQIARENNAFNKSESELAFQRQQQMTREQNAYNTPEAQMQRYEQAGLNKNLIYGQGTPGNQSGTPTYIPAQRSTPQIQSKGAVNLGLDNAMQGAINYRMADLEMERKVQENRLAKTQADAATMQYNMDYAFFPDGYVSKDGQKVSLKQAMQYNRFLEGQNKVDQFKNRNHLLSEQLLKAQMDNAIQRAQQGSLSKMAAAKLQRLIQGNAMDMIKTNLLQKDDKTYYGRMIGDALGGVAGSVTGFMPWLRAPYKFR